MARVIGLVRKGTVLAVPHAWRENATPDLTPQQYFTPDQIKVLREFVKYLYFASDDFARSARAGR